MSAHPSKRCPLFLEWIFLGWLASGGYASAQGGIRGGPASVQRVHPPVLESPGRAPEALFRANCATCHGTYGYGAVSWIDPTHLAPPIYGYSRQYIASVVRAGRIPAMPSFPEMEISDSELDHLATYVEGLPYSFVAPPAHQATVAVIDEDPWFNPVQISILPGQTVRFLNMGKTYHPVIDLDWVSSGGHAGANSGSLGPGGSFYRTYTETGVETQLCGMHPYMRGEVHVGQSFVPPTYSVHTPTPPPAVPGLGEIWVCAQFQDWPGKTKDGVVQVIDAATWAVTHTIPVGNNPHNLWFEAGGDEAVVTNWFDVTISRIDANTKTVLATCNAGPSPAHVVSDDAGNYLFATMEGSCYVHRFTQAQGRYGLCGPLSLVDPPVAWVGGYMPHGIWYSQGKLVTANSMDSSFSIIHADTMTEIAMLPTGPYPLGASANADGTLGATGNGMGSSVSVFDLVVPAHIRDIPLPGNAIQAPFSPDNRYIVAANGSYVSVIDAAIAADPLNFPDPAAAVVANIWVGDGAHGVAFGGKQGGGTYAYVSHKFENYVSVVDLGTMLKVGSVPLVTSTTGKVSLAGSTDTGGNGITVRLP